MICHRHRGRVGPRQFNLLYIPTRSHWKSSWKKYLRGSVCWWRGGSSEGPQHPWCSSKDDKLHDSYCTEQYTHAVPPTRYTRRITTNCSHPSPGLCHPCGRSDTRLSRSTLISVAHCTWLRIRPQLFHTGRTERHHGSTRAMSYPSKQTRRYRALDSKLPCVRCSAPRTERKVRLHLPHRPHYNTCIN